MSSDFLLIILMLAVAAYWLNAMHSKEIARDAGKHACNKYKVSFLDDTVVIQKVRLRRNSRGQLSFYREYGFEFTSSGDNRCKATLTMLGNRVQDIDMGVYPAFLDE